MSLACQAVYKSKSTNKATYWSDLFISSTSPRSQPHLSHLLTLESSTDTNLTPYGKELLDSLVAYSKPSDSSQFTQIKLTLLKLKNEYGQDLTLSAGLLELSDSNHLTIALLGQLTAGLVRKHSFVPLADSTGTPEPVVITGPVTTNDIIILGRPEFVKSVSSILTQALAKKSLTPPELSHLLLKKITDRQLLGLVLVVASKDQLPVSKETQSPPEPQASPPALPPSIPKKGLAKYLSKLSFSLTPLASWRTNLKNSKATLQAIPASLKSRLSRSPSPSVSLRSPSQIRSLAKKRKKRVLLAFIALLAFFLVFSLQRSYRLSQDSTGQITDQSLTQIDSLITEADSLVTLNPDRARQLYDQANQLMIILPTTTPASDPDNYDHTSLVKNKLADLEAKLNQKYFLPQDAPAFADISLLKPDTTIDSLTRHKDSLVAYSKGTGSLFTISEANGRVDLVAGDTRLIGATDTTPLSGRQYLLKSSSVEGVDLADGQARVAIKSVRGEIVGSYGTNLYIYSGKSGEIYKYVATGLTFSDPIDYLLDPLDPPPSATDMAIDGSVWLLTRNAEILKFIQGNPDFYQPEEISQPLVEPTRIYTSNTNDYLYILEPAAARVVIYDKTGDYLGQLLWPPLITSTGLAVSDDDTTIYLSVGPKLYQFPLADYLDQVRP